MLDHTISRVWLHFSTYHLMPRGRKTIWILEFCFCQWPESNQGCLSSKWVCHPLHHCLLVRGWLKLIYYNSCHSIGCKVFSCHEGVLRAQEAFCVSEWSQAYYWLLTDAVISLRRNGWSRGEALEYSTKMASGISLTDWLNPIITYIKNQFCANF